MASNDSILCLGIESTAHTFSVGIVNSQGQVLSLAGHTYSPDTGGLTPQKVVEHHYAWFEQLLTKAITDAGVQFSDIQLIAFSRGPGLGPCLRIGAGVARSLALKLQIPLVGVNHCIAHVEIGRLMCHVEDPLTLYVSGGNTIVSAFDCGKYQIFGETLDLAIGNMLDMVARDLGIPHPGGPRLEQIAKNGQQYISLPYIVKGMDLSFSGIYTETSRKIQEILASDLKDTTDLVYSLQETTFAMLTEVTERALAHTQKKNVLLTGGVAANKRLQEMLAYISADHQAQFNVVPFKVAGDNGAMIAWAGILQFLAQGGEEIAVTRILPKWRMDEVDIPWRATSPIEISQFNPNLLGQSPEFFENKNDPLTKTPLNDEDLMVQLGIQGTVFARGAEAVLIRSTWFDRDVVIKYRIPKQYRLPEIDELLRSDRTLKESRNMLELGALGIPIPPIYEVMPSQGFFIMKYIEGQRLKDVVNTLQEADQKAIFYTIGSIIGKIHQADRVHGDLTTSNIIITPARSLFFIDFGLTENTISVEDKAVDLHLFKRVLTSTHGNLYEIVYPSLLAGYREQVGSAAEEIIHQIDKIEIRGRYIAKEKRRKE